MKNKFIALLLVLAVAITCFAACGPKEPESKAQTIKSVLTEATNNAEVTVSGTVFGKLSGGFYLMDETGHIYVNSAEAVAVGDVVTVSAQFNAGASVKPPQLKQAEVTKTGTTTVSLTAKASSIAAIKAMDKNAKEGVYGEYVKITGTLSKDAAKRLIIADEEGNSLLFNTTSSVNELDAFQGKRVDINVVIHGNSNNMFSVSFIDKAANVTENPLSAAAMKDQVVAWVEAQIGHDRSGNFTLPSVYEPIPSIQLSWTSDSEKVTIANNIATVAAITAEETVTLKLNIATTATDSVTVDYSIHLKPITEATIADVIENAHDGDTVKVTGVILTYANDGNDNATRHGYILIDNATGKMLYVTNAAAVGGVHGAYKTNNSVAGVAYGVGDEVTIIGSYTVNTAKIGSGSPEQTGRHCVSLTNGSVEVKTAQKGFDLAKAKESMVTVTDEASLKNLAANLPFGTLVKISGTKDAPLYIGMSASSFPVNFKLLYKPGESNADCQLPGPNGKVYVFSFKSNLNEVNAKANWWEDAFGITEAYVAPKNGTTAVPVMGEVYAVVSHWTSTYYQLAIVDYASSCTVSPILSDEDMAKREIVKSFPSTQIDAKTAGTINLPASTEHAGAITWTVSPEGAINTTTGAYAAFETTTTVTLTAHYTVGGREQTCDVTLIMEGASVVDQTISEALTAGAASVPSLVAKVVTFGNTSGNTENPKAGFILTDGVYMVWYNTTNYKVGEVDIKAGDELRIKNVDLITEDGARTLRNTEFTTVEIVSSGNTIDYSNLHLDAEISSDETMTAYAASIKGIGGQVVKFSGDFAFVGTGSKNDNCRYQLNYKSATSSAGARYTYADASTKTFSFFARGQYLLNEYLTAQKGSETTWYGEVGIPQTSGSKCYSVSGTIYAVSCGSVNTMHAWVIINPAAYSLALTPAAEA